jgi:hypothetical protein
VLHTLTFVQQGDVTTWPLYECSCVTSRVLTFVQDGGILSVLRIQGDWLQVRHGDVLGWTLASRDDVRYLQSDSAMVNEPTWFRVTANVGPQGVAVRVAPRSDAAQIGNVLAGERIRVRSRNKDWALVEHDKGVEAWVPIQRGGTVYMTVDSGMDAFFILS